MDGNTRNLTKNIINEISKQSRLHVLAFEDGHNTFIGYKEGIIASCTIKEELLIIWSREGWKAEHNLENPKVFEEIKESISAAISDSYHGFNPSHPF